MVGWFPLFAPGGPSGAVQLNVQPEGAFLNFMKGFQSQSFSIGASPADLDDLGYPKTTLSALISGSILFNVGYAPNNTIRFKFKNTGTRNLKFGISTPVNVVSSTGAGTSYSGGSNSNLDITFQGAGSVTFTLFNYASDQIGFAWLTGFANTTGTGELAFIREDDEVAYNAGEYWTPEYLALMQDLNPKTIRTAGFNLTSGRGSNQSQFSNRTQVNSVSWLNDTYPSGILATISTSNNIAYTCGNASSSNPAAYVRGETLRVVWPAADNASSALTINRNFLGTKGVVRADGGAVGVGDIKAGSSIILVYDDLLGKYIYSGNGSAGIAGSGGLTAEIPVEAQIRLAKDINAHLWINYPSWYTVPSCASLSTLVASATLGTQLNVYFELGNEVWNPGFCTTGLFATQGAALGFDPGDNRRYHGIYALRLCEIMPAITTAWLNAGRPQSSLMRVGAVQTVKDFVYQFTYRFDGTDLNSLTYPLYGNYTGSVDHDTAGHRPRDVLDVISYAPYHHGANFVDLDDVIANGGHYNPASATVLQTAARNFALGGASAATALAWLDNDVRAGLIGGSGALGTDTLLYFFQSGGMYPLVEAVAASWAIDGRSTLVTVEAYEGAFQCLAPSAATCTTLGITADYLSSGLTAAGASAALAALLVAYKNSSYGYNLAFDYLTQYRSFTHSVTPCWFLASGGSQWSLLTGDIFSSKYQTYYGVKAFR